MGVPRLVDNEYEPDELPRVVEELERRVDRLEKRLTFVLGMLAVVCLFASIAMFIVGQFWK